MRTPMIAGNWKLHKTLGEATALVAELIPAIAGNNHVEVVVAPVYTALHKVAEAISGSNIKLAAQNCYAEAQGAFTGEVSAPLLKDVGCQYVIIGHSERRQLFGETDESVNRKVHAVAEAGLGTILCIGETLEERENDSMLDVLRRQVRFALRNLSTEQMAHVVIAYEPVWAIGDAGIPATSDYADARQAEIIATAEDVLGRRVPCLYGGSVNPENCQELIQCPHIDGLFIGRSAWKVEGYLDILTRCAAVI